MGRGARVFVVLAVAFAAVAAGSSAPARAQIPVLHLAGRGWGHGVGLAQWGAMYAAQDGADAATILSTFYPGTALDSAGGSVRVAVHAAGSATLAFPEGGQLQSTVDGGQAPGFPVDVAPGGQVVVQPAPGGGWQVDGAGAGAGVIVGQSGSTPVVTSAEAAGCIPVLGPCPPPEQDRGSNCLLGCAPPSTTAPTDPPPADPADPGGPPADPADPGAPPTDPTDPGAPPADPTDPAAPPSTEPPPSPPLVTGGPLVAVPNGVTTVVDRGRSYRGIVEVVPDAAGLRLVNELDVETYLKGMAEVPSTWPAAAQEAQAIAARTYVLRAMAASGEVCDYDRCQVYVGATREAPGQSAAVDATAGTVLTYGGALAAAVYSADAGGVTATPSEGFGPGGGDYPYLTTVRYDTPNPLPWVTDVALGDVGGRLGYPGTVTGVHVTATGPSGRALEVALEGSAGERVVDGRAFARSLGLRSTLFTASTGSAATAPAPLPLPTGEEAMALPDDAAALDSAVAGTATAAKRPVAGLSGSALPSGASAASAAASSEGPRAATLPATLAVAALGLATALAVLHAGGPEVLVSRWRPRSARSSSRGDRRRGPRRPPG